MKNIYLVGFMGTGKSAVGRCLARQLRSKFVDLDAIIEKRQKRKIVDIFAQNGEAAFRVMERKALLDIARKKNLVVACGGGIVLNPQNIRLMKKTGKMICLSARAGTILERTSRHKHRPLLNVKDKLKRIKEILARRRTLYAQAHTSIDTTHLSIKEVAKKVLEYLANDRT